jgi:ABC-type polysaccharide/polyol phosphate transport system ATPase subunit
MDTSRITCRSLWLGYREKTRRGLPRWGRHTWALQDIDLEVGEGELLGVVGGNGSGKTTLLRTISGIYRPSRGEVTVRGKVGALVELRPDVDRDLSVAERIVLSGVLLGFRRSDRPHLEDLVTEFGDLDRSVLGSPLYTLSAGMVLRLEMALLLHAGCQVLAIDELLAAADAEFRERCLARVGEICAGGGAAVLSSHDPSLLAGCDRVLTLEAGRFVGTEFAASSGPA